MSNRPNNQSETGQANELSEIVKEYLFQHSAQYISEVEEDVSLQLLFSRKWLSVRAVNICQRFWLFSLGDIFDFLKANGSFLNFKNCGRRTEQEIIALCKVYKNWDDGSAINLSPFQMIDTIRSLSQQKRNILHQLVEFMISKLTFRAGKGLMNIFTNGGDINSLISSIYVKEFSFERLKNIGEKSVDELNEFKNKISDIAITLKRLPEEEVNQAYLTLILKYYYPHLLPKIEVFIAPNGKIKLFYLLHTIIQTSQRFKQEENKIFLLVYTTSTYTKNASLSSIAEDTGLTYELARILMYSIKDTLKIDFGWLSNINLEDFDGLQLEPKDNFWVLDNQFVAHIQQEESVSLNIRFYAIIIGIVLQKTHTLLGDDKLFSGINSPVILKRFKNYYAISLPLFKVFYFVEFIRSFLRQRNNKISKQVTIDFTSFIIEFLKEDSQHLLPEILPICQTILQLEFDCVVQDGLIVFEPNIDPTLEL